VLALAAALLVGSTSASAQPSEPDVLYVTDWSVCFGILGTCSTTDRQVRNEGSWSDHFTRTDPPQNQSVGTRDFAVDMTVSGEAASFTTVSQLFQTVRTPFLVGGLLHGGGHTANIRVYVRGEPGTGYVMTTLYDGLLNITGAGSSGTNASLMDVTLSTNPLQSVPVHRAPQTTTGVTSAERHPTRSGYTLAAVVPVTFYSSSDYFFGNFDIVVTGQLNYQINVRRRGCLGGTISITECSPLRQRSGCPGDYPSFSAGISEEVIFLGDCDCCEYRRRVETWTRATWWGETYTPAREDGGTDCSGNPTRHGYRSDADEPPGAPVDSCDGAFDVFDQPDRATGCRYRGLDAPGPSVPAGFDNYFFGVRYEAIFTGQIVEIARCTGGDERVLTDRQWSVCIEFDIGGNPVPCAASSRRPFRSATPASLTVGGVPASLTLNRFGDRFSLGMTYVDASGGSAGLPTVELAVDGLAPFSPSGSQQATIVLRDPSSRTVVAGALFDPMGPIPAVLVAHVTINGVAGVVEVPLQEVGLFCVADFNGDLGVDGDDIIDFFQLWDSNEIAADANLDGGVDADDLIVFFVAWDAGC
jgi:hypothetical protein